MIWELDMYHVTELYSIPICDGMVVSGPDCHSGRGHPVQYMHISISLNCVPEPKLRVRPTSHLYLSAEILISDMMTDILVAALTLEAVRPPAHQRGELPP